MDESSDCVEDTTLNESQEEEPRKEPTHYSQIDLKSMKVEQLREELKARGLNNKGLRAQLLGRLSKALKTEEEEEEEKKKKQEEDKKKEDEEKKKEELNKEKDKQNESDVVEIKDDASKNITMDEKKIASLKANYELPATPHLVVHPSTTARGGKFNCTITTLSVLLDYRSTDNKEHSFEIFVFAELFNEMLQRDFGFYIYKTVHSLPEKEEEKKDKKSDDKDKKGEKENAKKEDTKDEKTEEDIKEDKKDEKKDDKKEEKKEETKSDDVGKEKEKNRSKSVESEARGGGGSVELPGDAYLLLSLVYFDTARCGYLLRRDLTTLFQSLGLRLCLSQLKQLLDRVTIRDTFNYKTLISQIRDMNTKPDALADVSVDKLAAMENDMDLILASGNNDLLPVFDDGSENKNSSSSDSGMVTYRSRLVDIGATLAALARSERTCAALEAALTESRSSLRAARLDSEQRADTARGLQTQLASTVAQLTAANANLNSLTVKLKLFHSTLKTIQTQVEGVVNIEVEPKPAAIVNGPSVCSAEKETKNPGKEEIKEESKVSENKEDKPAEKKVEDKPAEKKVEEEPAEKKVEEEPAEKKVEEEPAAEKDKLEDGKPDSTDQLQPENMEIDDK